MTPFQEKIHNLLSLTKEGFDLLYVSDQIEKEIEINNRKIEKESYDLGFKNGQKTANLQKSILHNAGIAVCLSSVLWICFWGADSCNKNSMAFDKQNELKKKATESDINNIIKACSQGDYATCKNGWLKYNTGEYTDRAEHNLTCQTFEEAYYNKTHTPLVLTNPYTRQQ
jgi:hypothetical protein